MTNYQEHFLSHPRITPYAKIQKVGRPQGANSRIHRLLFQDLPIGTIAVIISPASMIALLLPDFIHVVSCVLEYF